MVPNAPDASPDHSPGTAGAPATSRWGLAVGAAFLVLVIAIVLILTLGSSPGGKDALTEDDVRRIVAEVVGTHIAALPVVNETDLSSAQVQAMIDQAVGTQVALLRPTNTPIPPTPTVIPRGVAEDDDAFLGPEDAPVVIVEFSDFQCSYCGRWYEETLPLILSNYPDEVKLVYRDFPIFGEDSLRAALATECAREQDMFWEMHDRLFTRLNTREDAPLSEETLISFAQELGLEPRSFSECLSSQRYFDEVLLDYQAAQTYGLRGTPGFVINGVVYAIGAQPFDVFDQIIQSELARLGS